MAADLSSSRAFTSRSPTPTTLVAYARAARTTRGRGRKSFGVSPRRRCSVCLGRDRELPDLENEFIGEKLLAKRMSPEPAAGCVTFVVAVKDDHDRRPVDVTSSREVDQVRDVARAASGDDREAIQVERVDVQRPYDRRLRCECGSNTGRQDYPALGTDRAESSRPDHSTSAV